MKFLARYISPFFYTSGIVKKRLLLGVFSVTYLNTLTAQDSILKVNVRKMSPPVFLLNSMKTKQMPVIYSENKGSNWFVFHGKYHADTALINARYKPAVNPLLLWKNDFPLTAEQVKQRAEWEKAENNTLNQAIKPVFTRKKKSAFLPTL